MCIDLRYIQMFKLFFFRFHFRIADKLVDELVAEISKELQMDNVIKKMFDFEFEDF